MNTQAIRTHKGDILAFANDIALYALGYWTHEQHPVRINTLCLNTIQRKSPCTACTDTCPQGIVLHAGKANWTSCTNCNLCIPACPTSAINQSSTSFSAIRQTILEGSAPLSFACEHTEEQSDVRCVCLASIPWDLLAAAALSCGVVFKASVCKTCPHTSFVARVKETIRTLRQFLGKEQFDACVFLHDQPGMQRSAGTKKRLAFSHVADSLTQGAEIALGVQEKPTMSCYRALLLEVLEDKMEERDAPTLHWQTLTEDSRCRGCEICTKLCPHKALELHIPGYTQPHNDGEDSGENLALGLEEDAVYAQGQFLIHDASKCTQCGLCYISCPEDNLGGWDTLDANTLPALQSWPLFVEICETCGSPFKPQEEGQLHCSLCLRRKKV